MVSKPPSIRHHLFNTWGMTCIVDIASASRLTYPSRTIFFGCVSFDPVVLDSPTYGLHLWVQVFQFDPKSSLLFEATFNPGPGGNHRNGELLHVSRVAVRQMKAIWEQ